MDGTGRDDGLTAGSGRGGGRWGGGGGGRGGGGGEEKGGGEQWQRPSLLPVQCTQ